MPESPFHLSTQWLCAWTMLWRFATPPERALAAGLILALATVVNVQGQSLDPGAALSFNGTSGHASASDSPALSVTNHVTVEALIRRSTTGVQMGIVEKYGVGGVNGGYALRVSPTDKLQFFTLDSGSTASVASGATSLGANQWYHVAGVWNGANILVYVNGVLDGSIATTRNPKEGTTPLIIGARGNDQILRFAGQMDEVRIWNKARSAAEIYPDMFFPLTGTESNLVAYYRLDDGSGTLATNAVGNGNAVTLSGPTWVDSTAPLGISTNAGSAFNVRDSSAQLYTAVNPRGRPASAWFEWGATTNYGNTTPLTSIGSGVNFVTLQPLITGLLPGTTYHFRWIGSNNVQVVTDADRTFRTPSLFSPFALGAGILNVDQGTVEWGDIDSDGDLDFFLAAWNRNPEFWINNNQGASFTRWVAGAFDGYAAQTADLVDADSNGDLEVFWSASDALRVYRISGAFLEGAMTNQIRLYHYAPYESDWGDYDNDGDLDLVIAGLENGTVPVTKLFRNDRDDRFTEVSTALPGRQFAAVAWGDHDNDGDLDLALAGYRTNLLDVSLSIYRNDGNDVFTDIQAGLTGVAWGFAHWGDSDNDGDLDLLIGGHRRVSSSVVGVTLLYRNDGNDSFVGLTNGFLGLLRPAAAWGDFNNDGRLDFVLSGKTENGQPNVCVLYRNEGNNQFTELPSEIPGMYDMDLAAGDYDNDGRLDVLMAGALSSDAEQGQLYRNIGSATNSRPTAPTGLIASVNGNRVTLSWNPASDAQTPAGALTYNVRVRKQGASDDVMSAMSLASGRRLVPRMGNVQHGTSAWIGGLTPGTNFWKVQAVDSAFGGPFSAEATFVILPPPRILSITRQPNGSFLLSCSGNASASYFLQASANLVDWNDADITTAGGSGAFQFTVPAPGPMNRFFRLRLP